MRTILFVLMLFVSSVLPAQTIDFEDAASSTACEWGGGALYNTYRGLSWSGFRPLSVTNYNNVCNPSHGSGYQSLPTSLGEYIAIGFGVSEIRRDTPFVLTGFDFGTGWNDGSLTVEGWNGNAWTNIGVFDLTLNSNQLFTGNVTTSGLRFTPTWNTGTQIRGADFGGTPYNTFYIDNLRVSTVPEPSTYILTATGLAGLAYVRRRKTVK